MGDSVVLPTMLPVKEAAARFGLYTVTQKALIECLLTIRHFTFAPSTESITSR